MIQEDAETELNKRLRKERERLGFSQAEMALALGVSLSTQGAYEAGTRVPDYTYLARLSRVEGVDTMYVLTGMSEGVTDSGSFNWELHNHIFMAIKEWARVHRVAIPDNKTMDLLHFLYTQFRAKGQVDKETMKTLMRLVS